MSQIDRDALLRVLGKLGQSRLANTMNQIAEQANLSTLPVEPETKDALLSASEDIAEIRKTLITALGMEPSP